MKTSYLILSAAIPLLSGCAAHQQTAENATWNIKPVYSIRNATETPDSFYHLGRYYQGQSRLELALDAYQKALDIDANFGEALNGLGVIYAMQGKSQQALEQFRLAVKQAPNAAHIQNNLGYALYLDKSYTEAASVLEQAVALNPANQAAKINLALALDKAGDRQKAVQVMAQATQPVKSPQTEKVSQPVTAPAVVTSEIDSPPAVLALPKTWGAITQTVANPVVDSRLAVPEAAAPVVATVVEKPLAAASQKQPAELLPTSLPSYRIEVANGNGVTGMAMRVATFLKTEGYAKANLTNQKPFNVAASKVQYRPGYQQQAEFLAKTLPGQPGIVQSEKLRGNISVRVVLGRDMTGNVANYAKPSPKINVATY